MDIELIPRPKRVIATGRGCREASAQIQEGRRAFKGPGSYVLEIRPGAVLIEADGEEGAFYARQTLKQISSQCGGELPGLRIEDWPDFPLRGLSYDISRGRVPKLERLFELVDLLAGWKINQLQLYTEHTFRFKGHPLIGENASPLDAEEIRSLDRYCRQRHIELVPSLASFGHMSRILSLEPYRHLAEDWGVGRYEDPEAGKQKAGSWIEPGWTLAPGREEGYAFLESLYAEYLPLFSSGKFNACCDETFDLGWGQSLRAVREQGKGKVYAGHLLRLHKMAERHGKRMQIWSDVIRNDPQELKGLPKDLMVLDWRYDPWDDFGAIAALKDPGRSLYACPSVSAWGTLFPRLPYAAENISGFAKAARKEGVEGFLNTDWGDGGHFNFMENSLLGFALGAELGWNAQADASDFNARFSRQFLLSRDPEIPEALALLGALGTASRGKAERFWTEVFFAEEGSGVFSGEERLDCWVEEGAVKRGKKPLSVEAAREAREAAGWAAKVLGKAQAPGMDAHGVLPYWQFAARALSLSAGKFEALSLGGQPELRRSLAAGMEELKLRFEELWMQRNRKSEIGRTLARYEAVLRSLRAREAVDA
jgi:hypothetical protein